MVELSIGEDVVRVHGNHFVDAKGYLDFDPAQVGINEKVYYPALKEILEDVYKRQPSSVRKRAL